MPTMREEPIRCVLQQSIDTNAVIGRQLSWITALCARAQSIRFSPTRARKTQQHRRGRRNTRKKIRRDQRIRKCVARRITEQFRIRNRNDCVNHFCAIERAVLRLMKPSAQHVEITERRFVIGLRCERFRATEQRGTHDAIIM